MAITERWPVEYPSSDGEPMADGDIHLRQIMRLFSAMVRHFEHRKDIYVGADLLWYPIEGDNRTRQAPDVFAVPGRPSTPWRPSWMQWEEDGVPMRHVVEIASPSNRNIEFIDKRKFYDRYGSEEFVVFDPVSGVLDVHVRTDLGLVPTGVEERWTSDVLEGCGYKVEPLTAAGEDLFDLRFLDPAGNVVASDMEIAREADVLRARAEQESRRAQEQSRRAEELERRLRAAGLEP